MNPIEPPELFPNKTLAVAIDFLESSRLVLDYAIGFAHKYEARLILVHAIELSQPAREAEMLGHKRSLTRIVAMDRLEALAALPTGLDIAPALLLLIDNFYDPRRERRDA